MKNKVLYYALVDKQKSYDLPKSLPIPRENDLIFLNGINIKEEIVCKVNYISYHLNGDGSDLITVIVNCTKV